MSSQFTAAIDPLNSSRVIITAANVGNETDTTASITGFGATIAAETTDENQGSTAASIKDTFTIDFKGNMEDPSLTSVTFQDSDLSTAEAAAVIVAASPTGDSGVTMVIDNTFDIVTNPLDTVAGNQRIKYTYNTPGAATDTTVAAVSDGNTGGDFEIVLHNSNLVTTVTDGLNDTFVGTLDTFTVVVNNVTYTADFEGTDGRGGLSASEQATRIVQYLNDTNN